MSRRRAPLGRVNREVLVDLATDRLLKHFGPDFDPDDIDIDDVAAAMETDVHQLYDLLDDFGMDENDLIDAIASAVGISPDYFDEEGYTVDPSGMIGSLGPASSTRAAALLFGGELGNPLAILADHARNLIHERVSQETVPRLREIARGFGWALHGQKREDIVAQIEAAYDDPEAIAGALARLSKLERGLVAAAAWGSFLAGSGGILPVLERLAPAVLGSAVPKTALVNELSLLHARACLLLSHQYRGPAMYVAPSWYPALFPLPALTPPAERPPAGAQRPALDPLGAFLHTLLDLPSLGGFDSESMSPAGFAQTRPEAWPMPVGKSAGPARPGHDLVPIPPFGSGLTAAAERRLRRTIGADAGEFYIKLAFLFGLLETTPASSAATQGASSGTRGAPPLETIVISEPRLQAWLSLSPAKQVAALITGWLSLPYSVWTELDCLQRQGGRFDVVRRSQVWNFSTTAFGTQLRERRHLFLLWLRRLPQPATDGAPGDWVAARPSLRWLYEAVEQPWAPSLQNSPWGFRDHKGGPLGPGSEKAWTLVVWPLFKFMVEGPLAWLGLVDSARGKDGELGALRLTALGAAMLADRPLPEQPAPAPRWTTDGRVSVSVAVTGATTPLFGLLLRHFRLNGTDGADATWVFDRERVLRGLAQGETVEAVAAAYAQLGVPLPEAVKAALRQVAERWGLVNLYDELAVISFADAQTAREVLMRSPLEARRVYQVSETCYLVAATDALALAAAIQGAGHTPKILGGPAGKAGGSGTRSGRP